MKNAPMCTCAMAGMASKRRLKLVVAVGMALAFFAKTTLATHLPQGSKYDARIQYVDYNEDDVVVIQAYPGLGTQVVFSSDEKILDIACGFSQGWEILDKRNALYLKPKSVKVSDEKILLPEAGKWNTNLLVTTTKHFYAFDLYLMAGNDSKETAHRTSKNIGKNLQKSTRPSSRIIHARPAYRILFHYPKEQIVKEKAIRRQQLVHTRLSQKPAVVNRQYSMQVGKNSQNIVPSMAYDDGRFTYFQFPNNQDFPAVFVCAADGSERVVNTHVEASTSGEVEDLLVVHQVAPKMVLRSGKSVVSIYNDHFNAGGIAPRNGSSILGLKRVLRTEEGGAL